MKSERQDGFALVAALWALVLVGAIAGAYLAEARHLVRVSENRTAELRAEQAAIAGLATAHNTLERLHSLSVDPRSGVDPEARTRLTYIWNHLDSTFADVATGCLDRSCYDLSVRDLGAVLNVNLATDDQLRGLFVAVGADPRQADIAAQSIADWIDADDLHRSRGAERNYYLGVGREDTPRNGPIGRIEELRRVRGVDETLYERAHRYLSVEGRGRINVNSAPEPVLAALPGLDNRGRRAILEARRRGVVFANPFEVALQLGSGARARLQDRFDEFVRVTIFEPRQIEVVSQGRFDGHPLGVQIRGVYVRAGERVAEIKRVRLER